MSWHFSQALEAAFSAGSCSAGEPCARSSAMPTPDGCSWPDRTTAVSSPSRSGTMCEPLTASPGLVWWMSSLAASRARTSAWPERVEDSTASAAACGRRWPESFARWDRATCSWKTPQLSLLAGLDEFSATWPRWGMMRAGECSALSMPAHLTSGNGSGLWQTPVADDSVNRVKGKVNSRGEPKLSAQVKLWPTPHGFSPDGRSNGPSGNELGRAVNRVLWPTPTVCGNHNRRGASVNSGDGLATAVRLWPTPNASDASKWSNQSLEERLSKGLQVRLNTAVSPQGGGGGSLNPTWVEWLMGWPLGWTDCADSATARFRQWQSSHGEF